MTIVQPKAVPLRKLIAEVENLASEFPAATAFLEFRMYAIQQRQLHPGLHGGRLALIQPINAKGWQPKAEPSVIKAAHWCLWSNLFSQVVYTYHRDWYDGTTVAKQLLFPEVIGDCPSCCCFHPKPMDTTRMLFGLPNNAISLKQDPISFSTEAVKWMNVISGGRQGDRAEIVNAVVAECRQYMRLNTLSSD